MRFRALYPFVWDRQQSSAWTSEAFLAEGVESCQSTAVTFERLYTEVPLVEVRVYADPTAVVAWVSDVTTEGCTVNIYRTSGVDPVTVLWVADAPTQ